MLELTDVHVRYGNIRALQGVSLRVDTGDDHGAGDTLASAIACALAHGNTVPDAVAFAKGWVTECLCAAYPLGHGHGPVSALFRLGS